MFDLEKGLSLEALSQKYKCCIKISLCKFSNILTHFLVVSYVEERNGDWFYVYLQKRIQKKY